MIPWGKFGNSDDSEEVKLVVINLNADGLVSRGREETPHSIDMKQDMVSGERVLKNN